MSHEDALEVVGSSAALDAIRQPVDLNGNPLPVPAPEEQLFVRLSDVEVRSVRWLWSGRIPLGKVTILEGDPDRAKSTVTMDLAARVSSGKPLPDGSGAGEPAGVVLVVAEDDLSDTIAPRLEAHGADLSRIGSVTLPRDDDGHLVPLSLPDDLGRIRKVMDSLDAKLLVVDPITAYLSDTISSNNDASVRRAMTPLAQLAQDTGAASLLVRHLNKSGELRAKYRGGGSIAFTASARSVLVVEEHPDEDGLMVLARVKGNLARATTSFSYRVESHPAIDSPLIVWQGEVDIDADTLLRGRDGRLDAPARDEAENVLLTILEAGPISAGDVRKQATEAGISARTLDRAKQHLGVKTKNRRDPSGKLTGWYWELPQ